MVVSNFLMNQYRSRLKKCSIYYPWENQYQQNYIKQFQKFQPLSKGKKLRIIIYKKRFTYWNTDIWMDWCKDKQTDWLIDWLIVWLVDWLVGWVVSWLVGWLVGFLIDWLNDWLINWSIDRSINWLIDRSINWLIDWQTHIYRNRYLHFFLSKCSIVSLMTHPVSLVFCPIFNVKSLDVNANQNISENWGKK